MSQAERECQKLRALGKNNCPYFDCCDGLSCKLDPFGQRPVNSKEDDLQERDIIKWIINSSRSN